MLLALNVLIPLLRRIGVNAAGGAVETGSGGGFRLFRSVFRLLFRRSFGRFGDVRRRRSTHLRLVLAPVKMSVHHLGGVNGDVADKAIEAIG